MKTNELKPKCCNKGHLMEVLDKKPRNYSSVVCDICRKESLEDRKESFYHCGSCGYDMCHDCGATDTQYCADGHNMQVMNKKPTNYSSVFCDVCKESRLESKNKCFFHCNTCQYDMCHACSQKNVKHCNQGHSMNEMNEKPKEYNGSVRCDICRTSRLEDRNETFYHCNKCGYDMCKNCGKNKNNAHCSSGHGLVKMDRNPYPSGGASCD